MAPQPKKSKLTISSSSLASSSTSKPTKASKPARVVVEQEEEDEEKEERLSDLDNEGDDSMGEGGDDFSDEDDEAEMGDEFDLGGGQREGVEDYDTDDEIERVANDKQPEKSKKTAKRKRRATSPSTFGSLLTNLLSTDASTSKHAPPADASSSKKSKKSKSNSELQSSNILSLAPSIKKTISARQLETRARKVLLVTRQEKEDKGRVKDVIGGWGGREDGVGGQEWERSLRKVAQKGVVRLFNTILLSASQSEAAGSNSKRLDAPEPLPDPKKKKEKDNILGRGGRNLDGGRVTKEGFEALLKGGAA